MPPLLVHVLQTLREIWCFYQKVIKWFYGLGVGLIVSRYFAVNDKNVPCKSSLSIIYFLSIKLMQSPLNIANAQFIIVLYFVLSQVWKVNSRY